MPFCELTPADMRSLLRLHPTSCRGAFLLWNGFELIHFLIECTLDYTMSKASLAATSKVLDKTDPMELS